VIPERIIFVSRGIAVLLFVSGTESIAEEPTTNIGFLYALNTTTNPPPPPARLA
jgi:hypothetical protein